MKQKVVLSFLVLFLLSISACRIKYSLSGASVGDAKTFSVQYFQNMAELVYPPLSQDFTDAMKDRFMSDTNLTMVQADGDLTFEGEIVSYTNEPVSITANESAGSFRLTIDVKVRFKNKTNDEFDFDKTFRRFADYTDGNLSAVEAELVSQIVEELVDDIFKESVVNW